MNITVVELINNLAFFLPLLLTTYFIGKKLKLTASLSLTLFLWHSLFCLLYFYLVGSQDSDAEYYFTQALNGADDWSPGTRFVESLTGLFINFFGLSKFKTFFIYSMSGVIGLLLLANTIFEVLPKHKNNFISTYTPYIILLSPNLSFWSCSIGKDGIAFLAGCLAAFTSINLEKRTVFGITSVTLMLLVRPHIAFIMLFSFMVQLLLSKKSAKVAFPIKILLSSILLVTTFSYSVYYGNVEDISSGGISEYIESRQASNLDGTSSVEIANMPLPFQMFTYLFRPLFIDAPTNILGAIVSGENLFLLLLVAKNLTKLIRLRSSPNIREVLFNAIYFSLTLILLSITTSNLGIAIRQKTMFMPSLILLLAYAIRHSFDSKIKYSLKPNHK
jgi:hypothetical protein